MSWLLGAQLQAAAPVIAFGRLGESPPGWPPLYLFHRILHNWRLKAVCRCGARLRFGWSPQPAVISPYNVAEEVPAPFTPLGCLTCAASRIVGTISITGWN